MYTLSFVAYVLLMPLYDYASRGIGHVYTHNAQHTPYDEAQICLANKLA